MSKDFSDHVELVRYLSAQEDEAAILAHAQFIMGQSIFHYPDKDLPEVIARAERIALLASTLPGKRAELAAGERERLPDAAAESRE